MKKFKDILNENNNGELNNTVAVELIVKDFDFINNFLFPYIKKNLNEIGGDLIYRISDNSFNSTILHDSNNEPYLKYLNIYISINLSETDYDIGRYFTKLREELSKSFNLMEDSIFKSGSIEEYSFSIDYAEFLQSNLYKSMKGINKFKL